MVCGIGINDLHFSHDNPKNKQEETEHRIYLLWRAMIERCYSEYRLKLKPTYQNCKVCEKWLKLSGFVEDLPKIKNYELWLNNKGKYSLDKDLLQSENKNKIYSLETCQFVTIRKNSQERIERGNPNPPQKILIINLITGEKHKFNSIRKASEFLGISKTTVKKYCDLKAEYKGYIFKKEGDEDE